MRIIFVAEPKTKEYTNLPNINIFIKKKEMEGLPATGLRAFKLNGGNNLPHCRLKHPILPCLAAQIQHGGH